MSFWAFVDKHWGDLPFVLMGLFVMAYWGRVLWKAADE